MIEYRGRDRSLQSFEEAFRALRSTVDELWAQLVGPDGKSPREARRLLFVSPGHGDGTTTIASLAAVRIARQLGQDVALIETCADRPRMAAYLDLPPHPGFTELVRGEVPVEGAIRPTSLEGLTVIPAGAGPELTAAELRGDAVARILEEVARGRAWLLLDAPPLLPRPESRLLLRQAGEIVLVVRSGSTRRAAAEEAKRILDASTAKQVGVILNRHRADAPAWFGS